MKDFSVIYNTFYYYGEGEKDVHAKRLDFNLSDDCTCQKLDQNPPKSIRGKDII